MRAKEKGSQSHMEDSGKYLLRSCSIGVTEAEQRLEKAPHRGSGMSKDTAVK